MSEDKLSALAQRVVPNLLAVDMQETLGFYEALGFSIHGVHPDRATATWARVTFGDIALMFHSEPPHGTPTTPVCSGSFYIDCADVEALAARWADVTTFAWGPEKMWYGTYEFAIKDPNGYYIAFAAQQNS